MIYPDWPKAKIRAVTKDVWENLGRTGAEFIHLDKIRAFGDQPRIELVGKEKLDAIAAQEKPVIFFTGHFANWEVLGTVLFDSGVHHGIVYRPANNPLTDEFIIKRRGRIMSLFQVPKGLRGGRALVNALKSRRSLIILLDQKQNRGISVPFMGVPAMTAPAAARMSLRHDAKLVPIRVERLEGAHFRVTIKDALDYVPTEKLSDDVYALMTKVNQSLEEDVRARPGQWLWLHRRWKK